MAIVAALLACKRDEAPVGDREADQRPPGLAEQPERTEPGGLGEIEVGERPEASVERTTAEKLWPELASYRDWTAHTAVPVRGQHPQGEYIQLFYNETAKAALGGEGDWPNDVVFVKDNYTSNPAGDGSGELVAITAMKKGAGVWFWAQYQPDGSVAEAPDGTVIAGTAELACVDCHTSAQQRDHVITELGKQ